MHEWLKLPTPLAEDQWHALDLVLDIPDRDTAPRTTSHVLVPSPHACVRRDQRHGRHRAAVRRHDTDARRATDAARERAHAIALSRRRRVLSRAARRRRRRREESDLLRLEQSVESVRRDRRLRRRAADSRRPDAAARLGSVIGAGRTLRDTSRCSFARSSTRIRGCASFSSATAGRKIPRSTRRSCASMPGAFSPCTSATSAATPSDRPRSRRSPSRWRARSARSFWPTTR